ncbi:MAG TPA: serine hydrolase domain-containing protein [Acidimicrobiia bacterium]|nr:serine hydrolase domain-containing protein [Acidimicrobiia bacterium]
MRRSFRTGAVVWLVCAVVGAGCAADPETGPRSAGYAGTTTAVDFVGDLKRFISRARDDYGAPGAFVLLSRDGFTGFAASGTATTEGGPITADSTFRIASITKPIVAAVVLSQVDAGTLRLDDPLSSHLPGVVSHDDEITLRMLLDHTSGIFDPQDGDPIADIPRLTDPALRREAENVLDRYLAGEKVVASDRIVVAIAETHPGYFEPGTDIHYSNTNYQLLGMVLAGTTGEPLADLIDRTVAGPLGLVRTSLTPPHLSTPDIHGYGTDVDDGALVDLTDDLVTFGNGASGGVVSTPSELLAIIRAIVTGDLVGEELTREMQAGSPQSGSTYGLGLAGYGTSCGLFYGHEGGVNGMASIAMSSTDGADAVVIGFNLRSGEDPGLPGLADDVLCGS